MLDNILKKIAQNKGRQGPLLTKQAEIPKARGEFSPNHLHPLFLVSVSGKFSLEHTTPPATLINETENRTSSVLFVSSSLELRQLPTGLQGSKRRLACSIDLSHALPRVLDPAT